MQNEIPNWAITFSNYLDAFGYDNAGLAWGLAHIEDLTPDDHKNIINILTKEDSFQ
jgi:hypothetical protein